MKLVGSAWTPARRNFVCGGTHPLRAAFIVALILFVVGELRLRAVIMLDFYFWIIGRSVLASRASISRLVWRNMFSISAPSTSRFSALMQ